MLEFPDPEAAGHIEVEGGRIWYRANGLDRTGAPLVVIGGGPGMSHHYLLPLVALAGDRPVVLYDQLDTGNADRPGAKANWTVDRYAREVEALRAALGFDRIVPAGHSWGGLLAYEYALAHPEACAALVLMSPCLSAKRWTEDTRALIAEMPAYIGRIIDECEAVGAYDDPGYQHANAEFSKRHVRRVEPRPPEVARSFNAFNGALYNHMWGPSEFTATGVFSDYDGSGRLGELEMPVLFLCGEHDEARPATMRDFAARVATADVAVIEGASHLAANEAPEATCEALRGFLSGIV